LAARLGVGRDQIDRHLKELIDTGYVIRRQNGAIESAD
jgi:biotin operon repressor